MRRLALLVVVGSLLAACQSQGLVSHSPPATEPTSPIDGVVTSVDSGGLNEVSSFDLRAEDGATWTFEVGELDNAAEFPPGHLREHMATSAPVRVYFDVDGDRLLATRLEDAD